MKFRAQLAVAAAGLSLFAAGALAHPGHSVLDLSAGPPHPGHEAEIGTLLIGLLAVAAVASGVRRLARRR